MLYSYKYAHVLKENTIFKMTADLSLTLLFVLLTVALSQQVETKLQQPHNFSCQVWTQYNQKTGCECSNGIFKVVQCAKIYGSPTEFNIGVLYGYCMTANKDHTKAVVGACPFNERYNLTIHPEYKPLPRNLCIADLDNAICGFSKRTGQLCGQCVEGHSPPVYSYYPQCVNCTSGTNNWPKYLAVSLLPTTVFFLGVLTFRLRATSPQMHGYILMCQILTSPMVLRQMCLSYMKSYRHNTKALVIAGDLYISFLGIWNLDFFRLLYHPFCLHPNASTLQVLSLDYIIAAYPLALIILTYTLVRLHYHNCTLVVWLWRPFISCFARCRRQWDIQNSLVDAFATFLILSYVKFLSVSFDILMPTIIWDSQLRRQGIFLYNDGTVEYLGRTHLPYAILAISVLLVFTLLPILLLCLYPCRCFQRFLNRFNVNSQVLHTFMDTFQGRFKDGTNGTRDCRYFASLYPITRIATHLGFTLAIVFANISILVAMLLTVVMLLSLFHPYKKHIYNQVDIFLLICTIIAVVTLWEFNQYKNDFALHLDRVTILVLVIPLAYPLCLVLKYSLKIIRTCNEQFKMYRRQHVHMNEASALLS